MNIEPLVFFGLLVLIFLLVGQLTVALWVIYRLAKKKAEAKKREEYLRAKESLAEEEREILIQAQQQAFRILTQAAKGAARIEKSGRQDGQELEKLVQNELKGVTQAVKERTIKTFGSVSEDIKRHLKTGLTTPTAVAYQAMLAEVEEQKAERLKKVDEQIMALVKAVAEKVLGRALSLETHEELIFEALKKAKKEGTFR